MKYKMCLGCSGSLGLWELEMWGWTDWYCFGLGLVQGVPQYCFHFWFIISRLPRGLKIPSWTFFNSPFCVDFKDIHFFIIRWNIHKTQIHKTTVHFFLDKIFGNFFEHSKYYLTTISFIQHFFGLNIFSIIFF